MHASVTHVKRATGLPACLPVNVACIWLLHCHYLQLWKWLLITDIKSDEQFLHHSVIDPLLSSSLRMLLSCWVIATYSSLRI